MPAMQRRVLLRSLGCVPLIKYLDPSLVSLRRITMWREGSPDDSVISVIASLVPLRMKSLGLSARPRICIHYPLGELLLRARVCAINVGVVHTMSNDNETQMARNTQSKLFRQGISREVRTLGWPARPKQRAHVSELLPVPAKQAHELVSWQPNPPMQ